MAAQIEHLRGELRTRIDAMAAVWRYLLVGVAGVVALGSDLNLQLLVLVTPVAGLLLAGYWLGEQASLSRLSARIAELEEVVNGWAAYTLLDYESRRTAWRARQHASPRLLHVLSAVILIFWTYVAWESWQRSRLTDKDQLEVLYLGASAIALTLAVVNHFRYVRVIFASTQPHGEP